MSYDTKRKYKLVTHTWSGTIPMYDLQSYSFETDKWFTLHTDTRMSDMLSWCKKHYIENWDTETHKH